MGRPLLTSRPIMNNTAPLVPVCSTGHRRVGLPVDKDLCVQLLGSEGSRRKMGSSRHGRAFGGGGFARTMELQRNRRRSAFRKTSFARQSQQQAAAQEGGKQQGYLEALMNVLLFRAASRLDRGTSTCIRCQGKGAIECSSCKGRGILESEKAQRKNQVTQAVNKIRSVIGADAKGDREWRVTNRCPRCKGLGSVPCVACGGQGVRGIPIPVTASAGTEIVNKKAE